MTEFSDLFAEGSFESVDNQIDIEREIGRLSFREATVLHLWAICDSQEEVARIMECDQSTISRIIANLHNPRA